MKKNSLWKALGIAAIAAAVPVRFKKDEATGKKTYQSLLLSVDVGPGKDDGLTDIGINLGEGLISQAISGLVGSKEENHLFADDDPEAAVVEPIAAMEADQMEAAAEETVEEIVEETVEKAIEEAVEETAEETDAPAEEPEATEEDFDPEL